MFDKILSNGIKKEKSNSLKKDKIVSESFNKFIYIFIYFVWYFLRNSIPRKIVNIYILTETNVHI